MLEAKPTQNQVNDAMFAAQEKVRDWMHNRLDDDAMDIARLYKASRDKLIDRLRHVYEGFLGEEPTIARARRSGAASLIDHEIDRISTEMTDYIGQTATAQMTTLLADQPRILARNLKRAAAFSEIPYTAQRVLDELTTSIVGGGTFFDHIFNMTDRLRRELYGHVRTALVNGYTFDELRANVMKSFGVGKLSEPAYNAYGAVKVYKNEARRQWNKAMLRQSKAHGGMAVWWCFPFDEESTEGCVARHCMSLDDLEEIPPRHYNCRCTVGVFEPGDDLSEFKAEASVWLKAHKVSRRMAMNMEAGWSWGSSRLMPLLQIKDHDDSGWRYRSVPWTAMPEAFVNHVPGGWFTLNEAQNSGQPDHVLIRSDGRVRGWRGWRPIAAFPGERTVETVKGYAVDAPDAPTFDVRSVRVPPDVFERWPALRLISFPVAQHGESYATRVLDKPEAERLALALQPDEPIWKARPEFTDVIRATLLGNRLPADSYLALALPKHVLSDTTHVADRDVRMIVSLSTGTVLYARDPFDDTLQSPYERVAIYCPEMTGACWAVRPRGHDFWALPGGHIEKGEAKREAARREMYEETGLNVRIIRMLGVMYRPWSTSYVFIARRTGIQGNIQTPDEIDAAAPVSHKNLAFDERVFLIKHLAALQEAYNPEQPRDTHGRWGSGGAPRAGISPGDTKALEFADNLGTVQRVARNLGFDPARVHLQEGTGPKFSVGGVEWSEGGHYDPRTGEITLYNSIFSAGSDAARGLIAHEIQHDKFNTVFTTYMAERQAADKDTNRERVNQVTGELTPEGERTYPTLAALSKFRLEGGGTDTLRREDGVTAYSRSYWDAYGKSGMQTAHAVSAINETLAEIANLEGQMALGPKSTAVTKTWKDLYHAVRQQHERLRSRT